MADAGVACFPPYNCGKDWNVCYQDPNAEITKVDAFAACDQLDSLVQGGAGGAHPPEGGWLPTETGGWMKATGYPSCGWGSTYGHVTPGDGHNLESYGRVVFDGITTDRECCLKAAEFEGTPAGNGGSAIRFGVEDTYSNGNKRCFVDREMMMQGNLDTSSGRSAQNLMTCGDNDHLFWRHAAGSADASNLKSGGRCVKEGRFTKVVGEGATLPMGRLPYSDSWELPNHNCDGDPNRCGKAIRYNSINDAEQCCEACRKLSWLGLAGVGGDDDRDANPCLAWQIADGKCHILRQHWFDTKFGSDGLGLHAAGNSAMSIPEVIAACAGFADHDACARADNSHGYWASCQKSGPSTPVEDDCDYYSFMYYRESADSDTGATANATYRKIQVIAVDDSSEGFNITADVVLFGDRGPECRTDLLDGEACTQPSVVQNGTLGYGNCASLQLFSEDALDATLSTATTTVFNEEAAPTPLCQAWLCERGKLKLDCSPAQLEEANAASRRRRLTSAGSSAAGSTRLVLSWTSEGSGYDTTDYFPDGAVPAGLPAGDTLSSAVVARRVTVRFQASGTVEDYDDEKKASMLRVLVTAAGLPADTSGTLTVTAASVIIEAAFDVPSAADAEAALASLSTAIGSAAALTQLFADAGIVGVTVESLPTFSQAEVGAPSPPAAPPLDSGGSVLDNALRDLWLVLAIFGSLAVILAIVLGLRERKRRKLLSSTTAPVKQPATSSV